VGKILATTTTIAAQATPAGRGGIGVIRLSGPLVSKIAAKLLGIVPKPRYALHTLFKDQNGNAIDDGLALYFNKPNSFTGEDVLELQGHGGQVILDLLLKRVLELGAILARPGEFSERAFINGKIDLAQAEAIADLIDASSSEAALSAVRSLRGDFSTLVNELKEKIIALRVAIEAEIDFADEELELDSYANKHASLENILNLLANIQQSANQGALLRDGVNVVITGKPNAGKSSLLNYLAREDMAIVTPIPGTTRDVLRSQILLDGLPINIIDTAGLQVTEDIIEQEGIRRARQEIATADHILCIIDKSAITSQNPLDVILELHLPETNKNHITVLYNKIDLTKDKPAILVINGISCIYLSLKHNWS